MLGRMMTLYVLPVLCFWWRLHVSLPYAFLRYLTPRYLILPYSLPPTHALVSKMRQNCLMWFTGEEYYCADSCDLGSCEDDEECTLSYDRSCTGSGSSSSSTPCPPVANCTTQVRRGGEGRRGMGSSVELRLGLGLIAFGSRSGVVWGKIRGHAHTNHEHTQKKETLTHS